MTNSDYTTIAPEVQALVDAGEISAEYARTNHNVALLLVGFFTTIASDPRVVEMFDNNDREHFIEGMQHSPWFMTELVKYAAAL
jgi:hypothetical protein